MINVLVADDHDVLRAGLIRILEQEKDIEVVAAVSSGEEAYKTYQTHKIDVLLMDMSMPDQGGLETLKRVRARDSSAKIVMFSAHKNTTYVTQSLNNGALAYVTKSAPFQELVEAIRRAAIGKHYLCSVVATEVAIQNMMGSDNPANNLSVREFEIFRMIAEGLSHAEISKQLNIGVKTVSNYQTTLKQKLDLDTAIDFVRLAMRCGIIDHVV